MCMGLSKRKSAAGQQGAFVGALHIMTETFLNTRIWLLAEAFAKLDTESGHRYDVIYSQTFDRAISIRV